MTRRISLIITIVGAALVLGVPAAWGDSWYLDEGRQTAAAPPDAFERAVLASEDGLGSVGTYVDANGRALGLEKGSVQGQPQVGHYRDAFERALGVGSAEPRVIGDSHERMTPTTLEQPVVVASSGRDLEWPQIGIGFGIGLLLALGLGLAMRLTRIRPLAH